VVAERKRPQMISKIANQASIFFKTSYDLLVTKIQQHYEKASVDPAFPRHPGII